VKIMAINGTNAPAATRPLILFSMASATSNRFFHRRGNAVADVPDERQHP